MQMFSVDIREEGEGQKSIENEGSRTGHLFKTTFKERLVSTEETTV
jgi:hypothetical protein